MKGVLSRRYVLVVRQYSLRSSPQQIGQPSGAAASRQAPARPVEDPAPLEPREKLAKRELKRGVVALVCALIPVAFHALVLLD